MKKKLQFLNVFMTAVLTLGLLFVFAQRVMAKGDFVKLAVSGGDLGSEIEVTDEVFLGFLSFSDFPNSKVQEPSVEEGYAIIRYNLLEDGTYEAWDMLHYYPQSHCPGGYVYYDGLLNGSSEYDGKWYTSSPEADVAFLSLLTAHEAMVRIDIGVLLIAVVLALALMGTGWYFFRRRLMKGTGMLT